jgi:hypothetical protein
MKQAVGRLVRVLWAQLLVCALMVAVAVADDEDGSGAGMVVCGKGLLSVNAREVRPEDVMKELGERCGIKVVVHGDVFSEVPVSVVFQDMPMRRGVERLLRTANVSNYLLHFNETDNGTMLVGLDLIGKKGGARHLTSGVPARPSAGPQRPALPAAVKQERLAQPSGAESEAEIQMQENFLRIMDEVLKTQLEEGQEPDPAEILRLFKDVVPPEMKDQIPPEVLEELEKLER